MVRLDATMLRYLTRDDFRVLTAIEMGMKNHEFVSTKLIARIAGLKTGGTARAISNLHKYKLIRHENRHYDGYRLTYMGYDYLALKAFAAKGLIKGIGRRIGVGKESDIYEVVNMNDEPMVLKVHRLGRICFRAIKNKRDYLVNRKSASFMYYSRLAAVREFAYLKALYDEGFPTPIPYEVNRHCILMSLVKAHPMTQIAHVQRPMKMYNALMDLIVRFAKCGLVHGDFNEFNILVSDDEEITVIDFPQMVSTNHPHAKEFFERDIKCIQTFFSRKLGYDFEGAPDFTTDVEKELDLDIALKASGAKGFRNFNETDDVIATRNALLEDDDEDSGTDIDEGEGDADEDDEEEFEDAEEDEQDEDAEDEDEDEDEDNSEEDDEFKGMRESKAKKMGWVYAEPSENAKRMAKGHTKNVTELVDTAIQAEYQAARAAARGEAINTIQIGMKQMYGPDARSQARSFGKAESYDGVSSDEEDYENKEAVEETEEIVEEVEELAEEVENLALKGYVSLSGRSRDFKGDEELFNEAALDDEEVDELSHTKSRKAPTDKELLLQESNRRRKLKQGLAQAQIREKVRRALKSKEWKGTGARGTRNNNKNRDAIRTRQECSRIMKR